MSTDYYHYEATVDLSKAKAWEEQAIKAFLKKGQTFWSLGSRESSTTGRYMVFEFIDPDNSLRWDSENARMCQEGEAKCLRDIMLNLMARDALSLTYQSDWCSSGGYEDESDEPLPNYEDFVKLAEQMPTLVLQELLAKRLEKSE